MSHSLSLSRSPISFPLHRLKLSVSCAERSFDFEAHSSVAESLPCSWGQRIESVCVGDAQEELLRFCGLRDGVPCIIEEASGILMMRVLKGGGGRNFSQIFMSEQHRACDGSSKGAALSKEQ